MSGRSWRWPGGSRQKLCWEAPLSSSSIVLPPSSVKQDMLASLPTLDMNGITTMFVDQLKTCLPSITKVKDQEIAKLMLAEIRRETQLAGQTTIQDKMARMMSSKVSSLVKSLAGWRTV